MTAPSRLSDLAFVDLYLGVGYADFKAEPGQNAPRTPIPDVLDGEVAQVRDACCKLYDAQGEPEFALLHDKILYRVTMMLDLRSEPVFFLRRMGASIRDVSRLGLPADVLAFLMRANLRGLILFAGPTGSGKTSSAASVLSARHRAHGGLSLAIEDPPETQLDGLHGEGRCIQVPASKRHGSYSEQLRRAMRTGVSTVLIGEIRCPDTAAEAIRHSINGLTVLSTIHSNDVPDALSRLVSLAAGDMKNPVELLSQGLAAVIHQRIDPIVGGGVRMQFRSLRLDGRDENAIRAKLREGRIDQLAQEVANQAAQQTWQ